MSSHQRFIQDLVAEFDRALIKFPEPNDNLAALMEEVGELSQALLQTKYGGEHGGFESIYKEAVQVANVAMRIALNGDPTFTKDLQEFGNSWFDPERTEDPQ